MGNPGRVYEQGGYDFFWPVKKGGIHFFWLRKKGGQAFFSPMKKGGHYLFFQMKKGGSNIFPQSYFGGPILFYRQFWGGNNFFFRKKVTWTFFPISDFPFLSYFGYYVIYVISDWLIWYACFFSQGLQALKFDLRQTLSSTVGSVSVNKLNVE